MFLDEELRVLPREVPLTSMPARRCNRGRGVCVSRHGVHVVKQEAVLSREAGAGVVSNTALHEEYEPLGSALPIQLALPPCDCRSVMVAGMVQLNIALNSYGMSSVGATMACLPVVVPFAMPQVTPRMWMHSKPARAYQRIIVITIYVQAAVGLYKLSSGNLVGGTADIMQALMSAYALSPDGGKYLPTCIMVGGVNGVLGLMQLLQAYHGVPIRHLPPSAILPIASSLVGAYFGWEFCKEVRSVAFGGARDQSESLLVRLVGSDCWPLSAISPYGPLGSDEEVADPDDARGFGTTFGRGSAATGGSRFDAFTGDGHRLGEQ